MAVYFLDTFTGAAGSLSSHTSDSGQSWTNFLNDSALDGAGFLRVANQERPLITVPSSGNLYYEVGFISNIVPLLNSDIEVSSSICTTPLLAGGIYAYMFYDKSLSTITLTLNVETSIGPISSGTINFSSITLPAGTSKLLLTRLGTAYTLSVVGTSAAVSVNTTVNSFVGGTFFNFIFPGAFGVDDGYARLDYVYLGDVPFAPPSFFWENLVGTQELLE